MAYTVVLPTFPFISLPKDDLLTMRFTQFKAFKFYVSRSDVGSPSLSEDLNSIPGTHTVDSRNQLP